MEEKALEFREKLAELCEEYGLIVTQNEFEEYFIEPINDDLLLDLKTATIDVEEE
jgi:hypothetical protein